MDLERHTEQFHLHGARYLMARLPEVGGDSGSWGEILNDFLGQAHSEDGTLRADSVGASQIKPLAVTNAALANDTIQEGKLADAVRAKLNAPAELNEGSVTTSKLADGAVTTEKVAGFAAPSGFATLDADGRLVETQLPARLDESVLSETIVSVVDDSLPAATAGFVSGAMSSPSVWPGGRRRLFAGDSITNGSSASSSANFFVTRTGLVAGTEINVPIRAGFPGERADQIAARLPGLIATNSAESVHFQAGTNDLSQARTVAQFIEALDSAKAACVAACIPMTTGTVFARAASFSNHTLLAAFNIAIRNWSVVNDVPCANTYGATADPLTGYLRADYDAGDGVHLNNAGHDAVANAISATLASVARRKVFPVMAKQTGNLIPNPLQDPTLGGWSAKAGTGPTASWVAASADDDLTAGGWRQYTYDNTAGSSQLNYVVGQNIDMTGAQAGDQLMLVAKYEFEGTGVASLQVSRASTNVSRPVDGIKGNPMSGVIATYTVQAADIGQTMSWCAVLSVAVGATAIIRVGQMGVFNLTKLGLT